MLILVAVLIVIGISLLVCGRQRTTELQGKEVTVVQADGDRGILVDDDLGFVGRPDAILWDGTFYIVHEYKTGARRLAHLIQVMGYTYLAEKLLKKTSLGVLEYKSGKVIGPFALDERMKWVVEEGVILARVLLASQMDVKPAFSYLKCTDCRFRSKCEVYLKRLTEPEMPGWFEKKYSSWKRTALDIASQIWEAMSENKKEEEPCD